jgi:hypothetical protein
LNLIEKFASRMKRASLAMRVPGASRTRVERFEASRARVARRSRRARASRVVLATRRPTAMAHCAQKKSLYG